MAHCLAASVARCAEQPLARHLRSVYPTLAPFREGGFDRCHPGTGDEAQGLGGSEIAKALESGRTSVYRVLEGPTTPAMGTDGRDDAARDRIKRRWWRTK